MLNRFKLLLRHLNGRVMRYFKKYPKIMEILKKIMKFRIMYQIILENRALYTYAPLYTGEQSSVQCTPLYTGEQSSIHHSTQENRALYTTLHRRRELCTVYTSLHRRTEHYTPLYKENRGVLCKGVYSSDCRAVTRG